MFCLTRAAFMDFTQKSATSTLTRRATGRGRLHFDAPEVTRSGPFAEPLVELRRERGEVGFGLRGDALNGGADRIASGEGGEQVEFRLRHGGAADDEVAAGNDEPR